MSSGLLWCSSDMILSSTQIAKVLPHKINQSFPSRCESCPIYSRIASVQLLSWWPVWSAAETTVKTASPSWKQTSVGLLQIPSQQGPTSTVPQFSKIAVLSSRSFMLWLSLSGLYDKTVAWHRSGQHMHETLWLFCFVLKSGLSNWTFNIQLCAFLNYKQVLCHSWTAVKFQIHLKDY